MLKKILNISIFSLIIISFFIIMSYFFGNPIQEIIYQKELEKTINQANYYGILEIPKINLKREFYPLDSPENNVDKNIALLNRSAMPNSYQSNIILASHSGYGSIAYFKKLYKLTIGDYAHIYYQNMKYTYEIVEIEYQDKQGVLYLKEDYPHLLTLITCTKNNNATQTIYYAKLISEESV